MNNHIPSKKMVYCYVLKSKNKQNLFIKKTQDLDGFTGKFYQEF